MYDEYIICAQPFPASVELATLTQYKGMLEGVKYEPCHLPIRQEDDMAYFPRFSCIVTNQSRALMAEPTLNCLLI